MIAPVQLMLTVLLAPPCPAQTDSLDDFFPLAIGSTWTYAFTAESGVLRYRDVKSGTAVCQVMSAQYGETAVNWYIVKKRSYTVTAWDGGIPLPIVSTGDSASFWVLEKRSGFHELSVVYTGDLAADVWPLWPLAGDSLPFTRYARSGSPEIVTRKRVSGSKSYDLTFEKNRGLTRSLGTESYTGAGYNTWDYSLSGLERVFAAISPTAIDFGSVSAGTLAEREITLTNRMGVSQDVTRTALPPGGPFGAREPFLTSIPPYGSVQDTVRVNAARSGKHAGTIRYTFSRGGTTSAPDSVRLTANVLPTEYALLQNYPNPFNGSTTIAYDVPEPTHVTLRIVDVLGRNVAVLVNEETPKGQHTATLSATSLASGVYFYRLETPRYTQTKRLMLLK